MGKEPITGLSGVIFAQYGLLLLLRQNDRELSRDFGEGCILLGMVAGLGCIAFSTVGMGFGVDNLAHLAGLPYGLLWGLAMSATVPARQLLVVALGGANALFIPLFTNLMHPEKNARYYWWQAERTENSAFKIACLQAALIRDPRLKTPWGELAELELQTGQPGDAWRTLMKALQEHPELENAEELSRRIWMDLKTEQQRRLAWGEAERKNLSRFPRLERAAVIAPAIGGFFDGREPAVACLVLADAPSP